ncbi:MAG: FCD domain-containing protein [Hydrogenophaga sp.]|jgi:DNA-binding GntR family transcriptional regulator|uniref:FCD domain-containing protein n=1 Tax=Hydrogenophaga sp. TaxID=1904254 RepID=UPI00271A9FC2|nr:FCD domain-containing protein [Hydrogenophaga sp.]MDO9571873.1 FCD domain-containing protein [Hydrogenophaga sp.]
MNAPDSIALLRTQSLTGLVQEALEQQIVAGDLKPGDPLREGAIALSMGISRGPVREAIRMLEARGLVDFAKNCGVQVRKLDGQQAAQIYQVRIPLEGLIGELVAQRTPAESGQVLTPIMEQMERLVKQQNVDAYAGLNLEFHDALARLTGNAALHETYRRLVIQLKLFRTHTFKHVPDTILASLAEHTAIYQAVQNQDTHLASHLLRAHAEDSLRRLRIALGTHAA